MKPIVLLCACLIAAPIATAQCQVGTNEPPPSTFMENGTGPYPAAWPTAAEVPYVEFAGYFCEADGSCYFTYWPTNLANDYAQVLSNWSGFNISFSDAGSGATPDTHPTLKAILVNPGDLPGGANAETFEGYWSYGGFWALGGVTQYFTNTITNDHFMQFVAAHEMGHTFALGDCYSCQTDTTVMVSGFNVPPFNSPTGGLTAPSACDSAQVTATAYP